MQTQGLRIWVGILLFGLAPLASAAATSKEASRELEAKVSLESSLEKRLQSVLRETLGSADLIVIINVALRSEAEPHEEADVLPGVPAKETQASDPVEASGMTMPMVSRLTATIIVDQDTEAKDVELVTKVAAGILGISPARGDTVSVEKIKFHKPHIQPDSQRYYPVATSALWLLFAAVALLMLQKKFLGPLITTARDLSTAALMRKSSEERDATAEREDSTASSEAKVAGPAAAAEAARPLPFSFITGRDLPKLIHILRGSAQEVAATVVQYLPSDLAGKVLAGLEPEARRQVIGLLSQVNELLGNQVRTIEDSLRQRIDYLIGGEDKLVEIFENLPSEMQEDLLYTLRAANPSAAENVSRRLVFLDDLAALEPAEIKLLSRRVQAKLLAVVLKSSAALRMSILPKLAAGTREWLTQEIELSPAPTPEALEAARQPVLAAVVQLVREGRIILRKKKKTEGPLPSAVPQEA